MQAQTAAQRVFVRVIGFSDVERHALNSVFRLSGEHAVAYAPWTPDAPEPPRLALLDGQSYEAPLALASPALDGLKLIWIGSAAPAQAWRRFDRPIAWPQVVQAMNELFAPPAEAGELDFDLDLGTGADAQDTGPDTQPPEPEAPRKRALIASASREERLYYRARLALAGLTQADEAETVPQALELTRSQQYAVALVDLGLPGEEGWTLARQLAAAGPVILTKARPTLPDRLKARLQGAKALFAKPPPPEELHELLQKM